MPSKAFRIFAVVTALGLGTGYILVSLPKGIFGSSKAGITRLDPDAQPKPTQKPLLHSSKLGIFIKVGDLSGHPARQTFPSDGAIYSTEAEDADKTAIPYGPVDQKPTALPRIEQRWTLFNANDITDLLFNKERETRRKRKHLLSGSKTMAISQSLWSDLYPLSFTIPSEEVIITPQQTLNLPLRSLKMLTKERELRIQRHMLSGSKVMVIPPSFWSGIWTDIYPFALPTEEFDFDPEKTSKLPASSKP